MKKILFSFLALSTLAIASCSSDDNATTEPKTEVTTSQMLVGKWNMVTEIFIYQGETETEDLKIENCNYDFFDFKSNGTKDEVYHSEDGNCTEENFVGTWTYNQTDNTISTIDTEDNYKMIYKIIEISSNSMKLRLLNDDGVVIPDEVEIYSILEK
ncbi:lipocalin family protein [Flavobacterium sp. I3-2]|uniref:lipocalin family protein n=1 Tax=Flavobacterium sp. I3-2 TaxID=2748319 RepID=UPI0015AB6B4F|nr:lipocalin family protein [Flavobacterium sp. I3-2]